MKKSIKILVIIMLVISLNLINFHVVYADPNSSKGFADFDDEDAKKESEKLKEEQKQDTTVIKSTNNYLEDLSVEGYEISPKFDAQILEYEITKQLDVEEINIKATASDSKAKITGIGNVKLTHADNKFRIDVEAESGTVRTYILNVQTKNVKDEPEKIENEENNEEVEVDSKDIVETPNNTNFNSNFIKIGIILVVLLGIIIVIFLLKNKKNNRKAKR